MTGSTEILDNKPDKNFLCGVVEGFYGIPWTSEQRKLLFKWMNSLGMTTYMYAPKDDAKHRAFWRELYSVEEADNLTSLIEAACKNNVTFVYAISPGLDISFSNSKDVQCLKRKLEQVAAFGCRAFALLFDDIDPELSPSDKSVFQSSACAQVSITNEVFEYLGQPEFFFCPTEYCTSRCVPNLATSDYVNTVGSKLLNAIHILWTGSKVISKKLTIQELEEVARVFKRPPVIWDNIHANDYDPRRLYLGPYDGRSPEIIPYLRGVLTNPNCEFEANYVPLHTLGQWAKSNKNGVKKDFASEIGLSPVISDIKLESECECNSDDDITPLDLKYQPKQALKMAITDWLKEYFKDRHPPRTMAVARPAPMIPPLMGMPTNAIIIPNIPIYNEMPINSFPMLPTPNAVPPPFLNPQMPVLVNSLVDPLYSPQGSPERNRLDSDSESDISVSAEPMECVPSTITETLHVLESDSDLSKTSSSENIMQVEGPCLCPSQTAVNTSQMDKFVTCVSHEDLDLFISFFYLPFEYASKPIQMLQDLHWLKVNSFLVANSHKDHTAQVAEWWAVSERFLKQVNQLQTFANNLRHIPNQAVGFYFYPYLWDMLGVLQTCCGFVRWLGLGHLSNFVISQLQGPFTWLTKDYRDTFLSGDQEPWGFQGGLQAEFQRMLPIASAHDLLYIRHPDKILKKTITYRPYRPSDQNDVYNICLKTCDDGMDGTEVFPENPNVICDKIIGAMVSLSPEFCFVAEDDEGVVGYCVATLDTRQLKQHWQMAWLSAMQEKYPKPERATDLTPAEEVMLSFYGGESMDVPVAVSVPFPSVLRLDVLCSRLEDLAVTKRLLACTLSALKAKGSTGVHVELSVGDKCVMEHYRMLGFVPVKPADTLDHTIFLGRIL